MRRLFFRPLLRLVSLQEHKVDAKPTSVLEQLASIKHDDFFQVKNSIPVEKKPIRLKKDDLGLDEKPYGDNSHYGG